MSELIDELASTVDELRRVEAENAKLHSRISRLEAVAKAAENRVASCRLRLGFPGTREDCLNIGRFRGSCPSLPVCDALAEARGS